MKKLIYLAAAAALLASCSGTKDYEAYEATLTDMQARIDTISSAASYGAFLDEISTLAADFAAKDVKLNDTQRDRLNTLSLEIGEKLAARYDAIAAAQVVMPDSVGAPADEQPDSIR